MEEAKLHLQCLVKAFGRKEIILVSFFPRYEQRTEWIGENKCGGVEKASWLGEVGRL